MALHMQNVALSQAELDLALLQKYAGNLYTNCCQICRVLYVHYSPSLHRLPRPQCCQPCNHFRHSRSSLSPLPLRICRPILVSKSRLSLATFELLPLRLCLASSTSLLSSSGPVLCNFALDFLTGWPCTAPLLRSSLFSSCLGSCKPHRRLLHIRNLPCTAFRAALRTHHLA